MARFGLSDTITDRAVWERTVGRFAKSGVVLPTLGQLAEPSTIPGAVWERLASVDPDAADPLNLFRVHWYNDSARTGYFDVPGHLVLPPSLTGVAAPIVVILGSRFPMVGSHKVLAAFACLVPRLVTGQFDPSVHRAVWPSTGNYCRGGVAISRILGCRGIAVLPEGMSEERFGWLSNWVSSPDDVIRTPGTESNVKEIYDACAVLDDSPENVIFNQFNEFGNHLIHYAATGRAFARIYEHLGGDGAGLKVAAFVSATGSAGTIGAGDYLRETYGSRTVAVEALECPTLLYNGFGAHNIQGIGDKHLPLIHNVMATDAVTAVSDTLTDRLFVLLQTGIGREYLVRRRGVPPELVARLDELGFSGICNVIAAIKTARYYDLGEKDLVFTVATDSGAMYESEVFKLLGSRFRGRFDEIDAAETFGQAILGATTDHFLELSRVDRDRIFNLGYFTWVEQQGVSVEEFEARRSLDWWRRLRGHLGVWDALVDEMNAAVAARCG